MTSLACPKCGVAFAQVKPIPVGEVEHTYHHILPFRYWGDAGPKVSICRSCHTALEKKIPPCRRMPKSFYFLVFNNFIGVELVKDPDIHKEARHEYA